MRWVLAGVLVLAVVACGSGTAKPQVSRDGRAVLRDAYDGRLDSNWSCGSLRAAYRRLPSSPATYSTIPGLIGDAAARACGDALASLTAGDSRRQVAAALGKPDSGVHCPLYRWPPGGGSVDGARICFAAGRVTRILTAVHG